MILRGQEIVTIEDAFALLTPEQQAHAKRVSEYAEAAFLKIATMDLYIGMPHSERELVKENSRWVATGALYHDIGKIVPDETEPTIPVTVVGEDVEEEKTGEEGSDELQPVPKEHTQHGTEIFSTLYTEFKKLKAVERKMMLDAIRDHHESMDGSGEPFHKVGKAIGFTGRIVKIADLLDNRAMVLRSEDPITDVLNELKRDAAEGSIDPEFYKAFKAIRAKLKKIFDTYRERSAAVPETDSWIKRRAARPLELKYMRARSPVYGSQWLAMMYFKNTSKNDHVYSDVRHIVSEKKLGVKMGDYFLYEFCDALKRFTACGGGEGSGALMLPPVWYNQKKLAERITEILGDEEFPVHRLMLLIPGEISEKPAKTFTENVAACTEREIFLIPERDYIGAVEFLDEAPIPEDELVEITLQGSGVTE